MATLWHLSSTQVPTVTPPTPSDWGHADVSIYSVHRAYVGTADGSADTDLGGTYDVVQDLTNQDALFIVFVTDALAAQTILNNRIKAQFRLREGTAGDNLFLSLKAYLIDKNGAAVSGGTLMALTRTATLEASATALTNRAFNTVMTLGPIACSDGDRIVFEVGAGGTPTNAVGTQGHNCAVQVGGANGTDLPEDEAETLAKDPWISFGTNTLEFLKTVAFRGNIKVSTA